jgi:N-acetylglucosaminyl-diphospho-decaprenol L-rhamnosyltransferase
MPAPDIDVIIVAHDAGSLLLACVESVVAQVSENRMVVVDSGSSDGSVDAVQAIRPGPRVIGVENRGFAAANNAGIAATKGAYALLLNPDAELRPGAIESLVRCAEARPRAGIVGAKVLNSDGSLQANQGGRFPSLGQVIGLRLWRAWQRIRGNIAYSPRDFTEPRRIDWVTGACMLVRRSAMDEVGAMDEGYFLYYEDTEWCHRMRDNGWEVWQTPDAEVVHHLGQAGGSGKLAAKAYRESFWRYCDQHRLWGLKAASRVLLALRPAARPSRSGGAA